jgi:hypothetical protein
MSVKKAARIYGIPVTTLRDRVLGKVDHDKAVFGKAPLFDNNEEYNLVKHFKKMSSYGYGYTRQECLDIATDYAIQLGRRSKDHPLSMKWIRGLLKRWPSLKCLVPRGLEHVRAKMCHEDVVSKYFCQLQKTLEDNDLLDKPHLIFNVDEKGVSVNHKPPSVIADSTYCPPAITSGKGKTITVIGGCSASGMQIPPFFVFPGKRMKAELLAGKTTGADGAVSDTGWSNMQIFKQYLKYHFLKYVPGRGENKILLILDGHKSHVTVGLAEWAMENGIILFILPPHTSHVLQPLDVSCYGPFQRMYNIQCHKLLRQTASIITRYNVCEMGCRVYSKALSTENVQSGFKRTGIYPLDPSAISSEYLIPAEVYQNASQSDNDSQATVEGGISTECPDKIQSNPPENNNEMLKSREINLKKIKRDINSKPRNTMSKIVSGKAITNKVLDEMKEHECGQNKTGNKKTDTDSNVKKGKQVTKVKKTKRITHVEPQAGPSHYNLISDSESTCLSDDESQQELCCVCQRYTPAEVKNSVSIIFVKWAQCDGQRNGYPCKHWVHLTYCTPVRIIRKGDKFFCKHCKKEE